MKQVDTLLQPTTEKMVCFAFTLKIFLLKGNYNGDCVVDSLGVLWAGRSPGSNMEVVLNPVRHLMGSQI